MIKKISILLLFIFTSLSSFSQVLSDSKRKDIVEEIQKQITLMSAFSSEKLDMIPVYTIQIKNAEDIVVKYEIYKKDNQIYRNLFELSTLVKQNKEMVDFLTPRVGDWFYRKAISCISNNEKQKAYEYLQKSIAYEPKNLMANYELAKIKLDSGKITNTTSSLINIINTMSPTEEQTLLCKNLIAYAYDKNLAKALSLINDGKFAYATDILNELDKYCINDSYNICNKKVVNTMLSNCQNGIYKDHIDITKRAISMGKTDVAGDFVQNTFEYFQKNRQNISDTASFTTIVKDVVNSYIVEAKELNDATNNEAKLEKIQKVKDLASLIGGKFEEDALRSIASIQGSRTPVDMKLDSIENAVPNIGYADKYAHYAKDSTIDAKANIKQIEKDYIPSSENKLPQKSLAVESTKTKSLKKEIEDKFYESRTFMTVSNFEAALDVLNKANRLAKIDLEKQEVEKMYIAAIREITARRMSSAEYSIFQGDVNRADSLVEKTNDLITTYKMKEDTAIIRIMNSYIRVIDQKVCQKKQDEIDVFAYNIIDCIRKNDFYKADDMINKAIQIKGSSECRLDKQRLRQLKRQIEKPIEYMGMREASLKLLEEKDTMKFILSYSTLEQFFNDYQLSELSVEHKPLKDILVNFGNDDLIIKSMEQMVKYKQYFGSLEALGALKDIGYKAKQTKQAQKKIGKMMSLDLVKRQDKINESNKVNDLYKDNKWFKYFYKSYKKYLIKWQKGE